MDPTQLYQAPLLTAAAINYKNRLYVAEQLAPIVSVPKLAFYRIVFDRGARFKPRDLKYGALGQANMLDLQASKVADHIFPTALAAVTDPLEAEQAEPGFPVELLKTDALMEQHMLGREIDMAALLTDPAQAGGSVDLAGGGGEVQWTDDTKDPGKRIIQASDTMLIKPNVFWAARKAMSTLRTNQKLLEATKYTQTGKVSFQALADYLEVDTVIECAAFYDSAKIGKTEVRAFIWGKNAGLMYRNPNPNPIMEQPSAAYTFQYKPSGGPAPAGMSQAGAGFRVFRAAPQPQFGTGGGATYVKVEKAEGYRVVGKEGTFLFQNCIP